MISTHIYHNLYSDLRLLPESVQLHVLDYIRFLIVRHSTKSAENLIEKIEPKPLYRNFGTYKGKIRVAEDFNDPIDDFKDY